MAPLSLWAKAPFWAPGAPGAAAAGARRYLLGVNTNPGPSFFLRDDYHQECGWESFVREKTTTDPEAIGEILAHRPRLSLGHDPLTRLQSWVPLLSGFMFYFWYVQTGECTPSFVATDGAFSLIMAPLPEEAHLLGLPEDLEEIAREAWPACHRPSGSPLRPHWPGKQPAPAIILPEWIVVHRYPVSRATLHPAAATLRALAQDPLSWFREQPPLPGLHG